MECVPPVSRNVTAVIRCRPGSRLKREVRSGDRVVAGDRVALAQFPDFTRGNAHNEDGSLGGRIGQGRVALLKSR